MVEPKEAEIETEKLRVAPPPLILDDSGRIRLLHPSRSIRLREISQCAASFRSKITHFHQVPEISLSFVCSFMPLSLIISLNEHTLLSFRLWRKILFLRN